MTYERGDGDNIGTGYGGGQWWVFALVVIFLALVFWKKDDHKRDGGYAEAAIPALAMSGYAKGNHCNSEHRDWDIMRDQMREFANVREEIRTVGHQNAMTDAKYFYDNRTATDKGFFDQAMLTQQTRHDAALGFKDVELGNERQTKEVISRIDRLEGKLQEEKIQALLAEVNHFKTIYAIRGHGPVPAYPVAGPTPLASGFMHCAPVC